MSGNIEREMNAYKGYDKIVPSPPATSHEAKKQRRKKALLALICSTVLLIGLIYACIQYTHGEESGPNRIRSSDLVLKVCNSTSHHDLCMSALRPCAGHLRANMSELARIAVEVSRDEVIRVSQFAVDLYRTEVGNSLGALEDCRKLLNDTVDQLNSSVSLLAEQGWKQRITDLRTWLSAALTNPSTCVEGFEDMGVSMNENMKQKVERVTDLVSNALAIVSFVSDSEKSTENDP